MCALCDANSTLIKSTLKKKYLILYLLYAFYIFYI